MSLNYNDYAVETSPANSIATGDTSIDVSDNTAYPSPPFLIDVFESGNSPNDAVKQGGTVERMEVAATSGSGPYTWTVNRDVNGHNGSAQSFSTSAKVWHVQPAKAMGPNRAVAQSQLLPQSSRIKYAFDFQDGMPSEFTVQQGSWAVNSGMLECTSAPGIITITGLSLSMPTYIQTFADTESRNNSCGLVLHRNDNNNFIYAGIDTLDVSVVEVSGGTFNTLTSSRHNNGARAVQKIRAKGTEKFSDMSVTVNAEGTEVGEPILDSVYSSNIAISNHNEIGFYASANNVQFENLLIYKI